MKKEKKNLILIMVMAAILYGFFFGNIFVKDRESSLSERRYLAGFPKLNAKSLKSGKFMREFELYSMDQFVMREGFRSIKAVFAYSVLGQKDKEGIYYKWGHFSELDKRLDKDSLSYAAERFSYVYDKYLDGTDCRVYFSIIPDKNYFMAEGYVHYDYEEMFSIMREKTDKMQYISISELLELSDYYRTDPHWRQERIADVAEKLCGEMGAELPGKEAGIQNNGENLQNEMKEGGVCLENYKVELLEVPFYGAYCGRSALPSRGEELFYLRDEMIDSMNVTLHENNNAKDYGREKVYDMEMAKGRDPYEMFLSGSQSLVTIENPMAETKKELVLFRDSFGSSIAPLLARGYEKTILVDIRYIPAAGLDKWIDFKDKDVLFLYTTALLNHSETLK